MTQVTSSSASRSINPEPVIPRGLIPLIVLNTGVSVSGSIVILSIAPGFARMPNRTSPPSSAGPAAPAHENIHSRLPSTTSKLVPISINRLTSSRSLIPQERMSAMMSPPIKSLTAGNAKTPPFGLQAIPSLFAATESARRTTGTYGSAMIYAGSIPRSIWVITVFPATTTS